MDREPNGTRVRSDLDDRLGSSENGATGPSATDELLKEVRQLMAQLEKLAANGRDWVTANAELQLFLAKEKTRLFAARQILLVTAGAMLVAFWVFLCVFIWKFLGEVTGISYIGPLALSALHAVIAGILVWYSSRLHL